MPVEVNGELMFWKNANPAKIKQWGTGYKSGQIQQFEYAPMHSFLQAGALLKCYRHCSYVTLAFVIPKRFMHFEDLHKLRCSNLFFFYHLGKKGFALVIQLKHI